MIFISPVLSGIVLWASFPPAGLHLLAWIALVPLFLCILFSDRLKALVCALLCGGVFFALHFLWVFEVPNYGILHHVLLDVYFSAYILVFAWLVHHTRTGLGRLPALIIMPFLWVVIEFIRSNAGFLALPWGLLGHSQYQHLTTIQIASITGAYGISFIVVLINSAVTAMLLPVGNCFLKLESPSRSGSIKRNLFAGISVGLVVLTFAHGWNLSRQKMDGPEYGISVVQPNIDQKVKWDKKSAPMIMKKLSDLTKKAAGDEPKLIVWPETATPRSINIDHELRKTIKVMAVSSNASLLIGSSQVQKFKLDDPKSAKYLNSAYLIPPNNNSSSFQRYDKMRLMPFGEYLPKKNKIPWHYINVPDVGSYLPGKEQTLFKINGVTFGTTICWENIFPGFVRGFVKEGAQFIVNITNEAWFGETAAPYQFLSMNVMRAVENQVYIVRCANTGISCFIDPNGRITNRVVDDTGNDIFISGVITGSIIPQKKKTIYTQYGDWFVWLCITVSMIFIVIATINRLKGRINA